MKLFSLSKNKKRVIEEKSLDFELINSLDRAIHSRNEQQFKVIFSTSFNANADSLYSIVAQLIYLLSRKRQNNSLHMHMIMYLSHELSNFSRYHSSVNLEELNQKYLVRNTELLLENCYEIMELAERKTMDYKKIEDMYIFKDEKLLIRNYLDVPFNRD
jgi:hypothetical protein